MPWLRMDRPMLQVVVELGSDIAMLPAVEREKQIDALYINVESADAERTFAQELLTAEPETEFRALVAASGERPIDYLIAARQSYARLKTAESAGEQDWISRQYTAGRKYAALAVEALRRHGDGNEKAAEKLQTERFAVRRSGEDADRFLQQIKREGLSTEHRKLLSETGLTPEEIAAYQAAIQAAPAGTLGSSMVELYRAIAETRRRLAAALDAFAKEHRWVSGPLGEGLLVGNPREREAVVQLLLRRVALPPEWSISLKETPSGGQGSAGLKEIEKGRRYEVRLPPGGQIRVVSEVVPAGVVAENTTARWAVEGRIGEELLGGVVQEVNVPGFLPDLRLPPIASASQAPPATAPSNRSAAGTPSRGYALIIGAVIVAVLLIAAIAVLARRRRRA